jgi:hypothetical protein
VEEPITALAFEGLLGGTVNQRHLKRNRKFVDSPQEGRVTSELVSEMNFLELTKNQIFRGFWMIPAS